MNIDIICPLYKGAMYIKKLHASILRQKDVNIHSIQYIITNTNDETESIVKTLDHCSYKIIEPSEFSHSLTREKAAYDSDGDIIVFITQDVRIVRDDWLYNLVKPIEEGDAVLCYSRQLCDNETIEKYTRESNYPAISHYQSKEDIPQLGLKTFFSSDASSAISRQVFEELNGFDHKRLPTSEDMYMAYKVVMAGYKIKYCADSEVIHCHDFNSRDQYHKYVLIGKFFKENSYLDQYNATKSGGGMAKYILKRAFQDRNWKVLLTFLPNMAGRYLGMKVGKRS